MINQKVEDAMNEQIKHELYSSYLYLAMSAFFESQNLPGCAKWMRKQSGEENEHAMKIFDFVHDRGGKVVLKAIEQPPSDFGSPLNAFEMALKHEKFISEKINDLYRLAVAENDYPAQVMLHWFIDEQVEEEKSAGDIIEQFKLAGDSGAALLMMDARLGERE